MSAKSNASALPSDVSPSGAGSTVLSVKPCSQSEEKTIRGAASASSAGR